MTLEFSADIGLAPSLARAAPRKAGSGRLFRGVLWTGSAAALLLTLAAAAMPTFFALGGEGLDPAATVDLTRAMGSLTLAKTPSPLAARSSRVRRTPRHRAEASPTPAAALVAANSQEPSAGAFGGGRVARLIAPSAELHRTAIAEALHGLDRPDLAAATRFSPLLPASDEVAEAVAEDEALAEARVASQQPDLADAAAQETADSAKDDADADAQLAALVVPKPTFRPLLQRSATPAEPDIGDEDEDDDAASAPPRRSAAPARVVAPPRDAAPSPVMAYARPDAGALRIDPSAVDAPTLRPKLSAGTAIYDITAATVYLPNGERLEAHSGLGKMRDNPRFVHQKNRGPTPPHTYRLSLRESLFHGVQALRLTPVGGERKIFNRNGLLAHTYMLGKGGDSNGCVSFRDYKRFLAAFRRGDIRQLVVVERMDTPSTKSRFAWLFGQ
ncbi:tlde1 domain-containing protein (plasmid) [Aureimonas ureilytica]|uniref:DUF2778 domain-containing protein n=1 Tax=Aureimonas ureilytica TaxID=401562 RepID=UPI003CFA90A1